jgi:recombination protein RecA
MPSFESIRAQVEEAVPGALRVYRRTSLEVVPTGMPELDSAIGGIPKAALTQLCAPAWSSSGRTSLLHSLLARATAEKQYCALVDAADSFDCNSAAAKGVLLSRVFWIRGSEQRQSARLEQGFRSADIVLQNGGFSIVILDLGSIDDVYIRKVPLTTWFRFSRVVEKSRTALICLVSSPVAHSCAALTLQFRNAKIISTGATSPSHAGLVEGLDADIEVLRSHLKKPVQSARPNLIVRVSGQ